MLLWEEKKVGGCSYHIEEETSAADREGRGAGGGSGSGESHDPACDKTKKGNFGSREMGH